jgi:hypothetical protein
VREENTLDEIIREGKRTRKRIRRKERTEKKKGMKMNGCNSFPLNPQRLIKQRTTQHTTYNNYNINIQHNIQHKHKTYTYNINIQHEHATCNIKHRVTFRPAVFI